MGNLKRSTKSVKTYLSLLLIVITFNFTDATAGQRLNIIIKADDFPARDQGMWNNYFELLQLLNVKSTLGVISSRITNKKASLISSSTVMYQNGLIEYFYHGITHVCTNKESEFTTSIEEQLENLKNGIATIKEKVGNHEYGFGAPCNVNNIHTASALNNFKIKYWLLPIQRTSYNYKGLVLNKRINVEKPIFRPNYDSYLKESKKKVNLANYYVIQVHPGAWKNEDLINFRKVLEDLILKRAIFYLPKEIYD